MVVGLGLRQSSRPHVDRTQEEGTQVNPRRTIAIAIGAGAFLLSTLAPGAAAAGGRGGAVFTESNQASGNAILMWNRATDGSLTPAPSLPTGGLGTGAGLGSQGAVTLSPDGEDRKSTRLNSSHITIS